MKTPFTFLIILFTINNYLNAQNSSYVEYYPNGRIYVHGVLQNNLEEGYWTEFYPNGIMKARGLFVKGKRDGYWQFYDEEGYLINQIFFDPNKKPKKYTVRW